MTVKQLIEALSDVDPGMDVLVMQYNPVDGSEEYETDINEVRICSYNSGYTYMCLV